MATNETRDFMGVWFKSVICSDPTTPAAGDPIRCGVETGIALTNESAAGTDLSGNATGYTSVNVGPFRAKFSCKGINDSGNSAIADGDTIYYVDADTPKLSKKAAGYFFGLARGIVTSGSTTTIEVDHIPSPGAGTLGTGTVGSTQLADLGVATGDIADNAVTAGKLTATLGTGFIPLDIGSLRIIASNVIGNTTEGMLLDGNTAPSLQRVNAATDKALRVIWAASSSIECQFPPVAKPPDLDGTADLTVHMMIGKDTNTDNTVTIDVQMFDGVGDTEAGSATAALATATLTEYIGTILAADLAEHPGFLNISLVPGTHTTDAIWLYAAWVEYTRK